MQQSHDIKVLEREAKTRWLKPTEVLFILQNHERFPITSEPPNQPPSGSLFLFNRRVLRFFRKDGHSWRRKKDGRTVGEAHERLKVGNVDALNCYYAHGDQNPGFQRRIFWMLDLAYEHIVLVHYREVAEGRYMSRPISNFSVEPSTLNRASSSSNKSYSSLSSGEEISLPFALQNSNPNTDNTISSSEGVQDYNQALKKLAVQLSLEDDDDDYFYLDQKLPQNSGGNEGREPPFWKDMLELSDGLPRINSNSNNNNTTNFLDKSRFLNSPGYRPEAPLELQNNRQEIHGAANGHQMDETELRHRLSATKRFLLGSDSLDSPSQMNDALTLTLADNNNINNNEQTLLGKLSSNDWIGYLQLNVDDSSGNKYSSDFSPSWFDHGQLTVTLAQKQRFSIREISPEWAFSSESTKVIITGTFLSNPLEAPLAVMFGDIEVSVDLLQDGVLKCYTTPEIGTGKVTLCITSANRESCSEIRDFEFRAKPTNNSNSTPTAEKYLKTDDELSLVTKLTQILLGGVGEDQFGVNGNSSFDWVIEELLKDKLVNFLKYRRDTGHDLTKREQGIIHVISGLGFEWALSPILDAGVGINFRDSNGWTALHWAAYFGRERMVAALLAKGASANAVTDPNPQDPVGKTPGFLASLQGHKGLAAYLSETALTTHLRSLTIEENQMSRGSAELEAERALESFSGRTTVQSIGDSEDELSLRDSLAAVRNSAQAAARIQAAFRAFSFRRRQQKTNLIQEEDEHGMTQEEINEISSKLHGSYYYKNSSSNIKYDKDRAALSIQKRFRCWKGRKNFLNIRQNVVKIQAHVRGHQVRKKYREFLWTVSVVEKAVLRWRRKGAGLRGFRVELSESTEIEECDKDVAGQEELFNKEIIEVEEEEEEDIAKVFRKQKVDNALDEAVSRVLSMVDSPDARQQYRRMIERFHEAKAEESTREEATSRLRDELEIVDADTFMY